MQRTNSFLKGASALVIASALGFSAHAQEAERPDWMTEEFTYSNGKAFEVDDLVDILPSGLVLYVDEAEFDEDTGAMVLEDVELSFEGIDDLAIEIDELRVWGLDLGYLGERMAGEELDTRGRIARRIEADDVELVGLEGAMAGFMDAYMGAIEGSMEGAFPEDFDDEELDDAFDVEISDYEVSFDTLIIEDLKLLPWELVPVDAGDGAAGFAELMPFLQGYAAWMRVFEFDGLAMEEITFAFGMEQAEIPLKMEYDVETLRYEAYRGGDQALMAMEGVSGSFQFVDPEIGDEPFFIDFSVDSYSISDMALEKAMGYLARGEMPPKTETDLMSLGVWETMGESYEFNGESFYSLDSSRIDLSEWHWLMPAKASVSVSNFTLDIEGYMSSVFEMMEDTGDADFEELAMFYEVMDVLGEYDLSAPSMDYSLIWNWSPESGDTTTGLAFGLDGYQRFALLIAGTLPDYEGMTDPIAVDFSEFDGDLLGAAFEEFSSLSSVKLEIIDEGGFEKAFPLVIELATLFQDMDDGAEFIANATPETLKGFVTGGITFGAEQAAELFPPVRDYAAQLVAFIEEGGRFVVEIEPETPLSSETAEDIEDMVEGDPEALIEFLGVDVRHDSRSGD